MFLKIKKIILLSFLFLLFSFLSITFASITDGTIDSVNKYAWGEQIGWPPALRAVGSER